jgi:ADP-ribosyl-[dinitrogen reductase] hydrolase
VTLHLTGAQVDRAGGVLLGTACGDALGAPYEFGPPLRQDVPVTMAGGGSVGWSPGEWTKDTSMAIAIAEVSADGIPLDSMAARDRIAACWMGWAAEGTDVGAQNSAVFSAATRAGGTRGYHAPTADDLALAALEHDRWTGRSGGNGSLMRTRSHWPT